VLAAILLEAENLHLRAIADRTGLPRSIIQREVDRLERARLVTTTKSQTARVVRANEHHPLYPELRALLLKAYGPTVILSELLDGEVGIEEAHLFGSWASRYEGLWGEPPADVDVLVVGSMALSRAEELEAEAEDRLGQPVHITVVPSADWRSRKPGFVRTVRQRPLVPIMSETE
jgi:predicted nucleotidyltransferase